LLSSSIVSLYDPQTGMFVAGPRLTTARHKISSVALTDGSVLIAGGGRVLAELYDPRDNRFAEVSGAANSERFFPTVTPLSGGRVLISGGYTRGGSQRDTWIFHP